VPSTHAHAPAPSAQRTPGCPALPGRVAHSCPAPPAMLLCCTSLPCLAWYGRWGCLPHTPYPCPMPCPLPLLIPLPSSAQPSTPAPQHSALGAAVARRPPSPGKRGTLPHSPEPRLRRDWTPPPVPLMEPRHQIIKNAPKHLGRCYKELDLPPLGVDGGENFFIKNLLGFTPRWWP